MNGYWDDLDTEMIEVLTVAGPMDPVDLAKALGMSTAAVCSCLAMLSAEGKVRIRSVEATPPVRPLARVAGERWTPAPTADVRRALR